MQVQANGATPTLLRGVTPAVHRIRPALVGNPLAKSQKELVNEGYPLRPDSALAPNMYKEWLRVVSSPATEIVPKLVTSPRRHGSFVAAAANIWGGWAINSPVIYEIVYSLWSVPYVSIASIAHGDYYASPWVGLDGWNRDSNGPLIQCGFDLDVFSYVIFPPAPWYEYFPDGSVYPSNLPLSFGDTLFAEAASVDSNGYPSPSGQVGYFYMYDWTNGYYISTTYAKPSNSEAYLGGTAEWIIESFGGGDVWLAKYSNTIVTELLAEDSSQKERTLANDNQIDINMTDNGQLNGRLLTAAYPNAGYTQLNFQWYAAQLNRLGSILTPFRAREGSSTPGTLTELGGSRKSHVQKSGSPVAFEGRGCRRPVNCWPLIGKTRA
jgi:hypothetical protein